MVYVHAGHAAFGESETHLAALSLQPNDMNDTAANSTRARTHPIWDVSAQMGCANITAGD